MSLDNNLFTLSMAESEKSPGDFDCTDPRTDEVLYRKKRITTMKGPAYHWVLIDPISDALLATVTALNQTSKTKTITLHDPDVSVELKFTGSMSFKWNLTWEQHEFEWRKDACYLVRKPDPPVQVAVTDPPRKGRPASVQLLDYNLRRFDIDDRKGLEVVLLAALLTFSDYTEGFRDPTNAVDPTTVKLTATTPPAGGNSSGASSGFRFGLGGGSASPPAAQAVPPPPRIQFTSSDANEIMVTEEGTVPLYAEHCASVLADRDVLFIIIRSSAPEVVPRVFQIAQETKRLRHRALEAADEEEEELYQYVTYDEPEQIENGKKKKPKKVIRLDDAPKPVETSKKDPNYKPLTTLTIHISKIPMPELGPSPSTASERPRRHSATPLPTPSKPSNNVRPSSHSRISSSSATPSSNAGKLQKPSNIARPSSAGGRPVSPQPPPASLLSTGFNRPTTKPRPTSAIISPSSTAGPTSPAQNVPGAFSWNSWTKPSGSNSPSSQSRPPPQQQAPLTLPNRPPVPQQPPQQWNYPAYGGQQPGAGGYPGAQPYAGQHPPQHQPPPPKPAEEPSTMSLIGKLLSRI